MHQMNKENWMFALEKKIYTLYTNTYTSSFFSSKRKVEKIKPVFTYMPPVMTKLYPQIPFVKQNKPNVIFFGSVYIDLTIINLRRQCVQK